MVYMPLSVLQLREFIEDPECLIIDIRDMQSFETNHIPGAVAMSDQVIIQLIRSKQKDRPVVVYCYRGISSRDICRLLVSSGYRQVYNLEGGWQAWNDINEEPGSILSVQTTRWLSQQGFDANNINSRIKNGMSPLMVAAKEGNIDTLWELLEAGADVNLLNDDENPAIWFACFSGKESIVNMLIEYGAKLDNQNVNGATCLIYAASTGKIDVVKALVEAGAEIESKTLDGFTALDSAASIPVLRYLRPLYVESARP